MKSESHQLLNEAVGLFGEVNSNISHEFISKRVLLLMGMTKAGKTTLLYYLLGKRLLLEKNELDVYQMRPQIQYFGATIGNGYDSETVYPNIPAFQAQTDDMVIDMPGFDDNRNQYRLLNVYILLQTLRKIDQVHICHVIPEESLEGSKLLFELQKISHFFNQQLITSPNYLSFVLTKVEDENVIESFHDQVEEFRSEQLPESIHESFEHIKKKNVNLFFSNDPDPEQGEKMKQKIILENSFMPINKDPFKLLSQNYCKWIIGEHDLLTFISYIHSLVDSLQEILPNLLQLFTLIVNYEFQQIFAVFAQIERQQYQIQLISKLQIQKTRVPLQNIDQQKMEVLSWQGMSKDKYVTALTIFQQIQSDENKVCQVLDRFSKVISTIKSGKICHFKSNFLNKVELCLRNISSLISTLKQIKQPEILELLKQVYEDQKIEALINTYFDEWKEKSPKLSSLKGILQLFNDSAYKQLLQRNNITLSPILIQKKPVHHQIYRKSILDAIEKATANAQKKQLAKIEIAQKQKHEQLTSDIIQTLQMHVSSLSFLLQVLVEYKSNKNIENKVLLQIIQKIATIFYRYSYIQQAICFYLCIPDDNSAEDIMKIGIDNNELDQSFITDILLPYYTRINPNFDALQNCYSYLLQCSKNPQEVEKQYVTALKDMISRREECYLISERCIRFNFEFINPILENKDVYLQLLVKKQNLFEKSPLGCQNLLHFITKKMI